MIPLFPVFKTLELKDKDEVVKHVSQFGSNSDWNFIGLWGYNTRNDILISWLNGNLAIRSRDYLTNDFFYSFIGINHVIHTSQTLLNYSLKQKTGNVLKLIPEIVINADQKISDHFIVKEDRDNFDYILLIDELCELNGSKYRKHRRSANKFKQLYISCKIQEIDLSKNIHQKQIYNLIDLWKEQKKQTNTEHELIAIQRTLKDLSIFNTLCLGIFDKEKLIGFAIADLENKEHAETHFVKCDYSYDGGYQILRQELAKALKKIGYKYLNIEQDLGIPGLRFAKEQWNPICYVKKYTISLKDK
jgi:uncharacterized protein